MELDLKQSSGKYKLSCLIDSLHLTDDIIVIIEKVTEVLYQKINCDSINILFNNEKSRHFYINKVLNHPDHENGGFLIIPYNETTLTEILRSHHPIVRYDLSLRGELTPGDLKFLVDGIKSDLSVPVIHQNKVLAIINLSSFDRDYFEEAHKTEAEQIASLLGLALGRIELIEKLEEKNSELLLWSNKFKSLVNSMSEPVAIVRDDYDLIYEANLAFQKLTGYSAENLHGMRLSCIHSQNKKLILEKLDKKLTNGKIAFFEQIILNCKDGTQFPVSLKFVPIGNSVPNFIYAFYQKIPEIKDTDTKSDDKIDTENEFNLQQVSVFNKIIDLANAVLDFNDFIKLTMLAIQKVVDFDFAQVTLFDSAGEHVENHTIISNHCREFDDQTEWNILENSDSCWYRFSQKNLKKQIKENNPGFINIEKQLKSRDAAVLTTQNRNIGTLLFGSLKSNFYRKYQINFIKQIADQLAILIEREKLIEECEQHTLNFSMQSDLSRIVGTNLNIKHVLSSITQLSAEKMNSQLTTIQLMEKGSFSPDITINDPDYDKAIISNFEKDIIIPELFETKKSYIIKKIHLNHSNHAISLADFSNDYRMYLTIPLKSGEKLIGMLTNYWKKVIRLSPQDYKLITAIGNQASVAIENASLFQESINKCDRFEKAKVESEKFVENVSHDLKTSLASIQGLTTAVFNNLKEKIGDDDLLYLQRIKKSSIFIREYIDGLLKLFRVGQSIQQFEEVNAFDLIETTKIKLDRVIRDNNVKIIVHKEMPMIKGDRHLLQLVFDTLIEMSIKYSGTENKRLRIEIGYKNELESGILSIQNNNANLRKNHLENIFDLCRRVEDRSTEEEGINLGLAIAKKIVEIHNGQIWFESEEAKGGTFYFTLPG